jgi:hypothetical protein
MEYKFIGWCKDGTSDKVWVMIQLSGDQWSGSYVTVWGRRGRALQHKVIQLGSNWEMEKLTNSKIKKGYNSIESDVLDQVYPEFAEDLEKISIWATLGI